MIIDHINNYQRYQGLGRSIGAALRHISQEALRFSGGAFLKPKTEYRLNDTANVLVFNDVPKTPEAAVLEAHRGLVDVHYMALGNGRVGWTILGDRKPFNQYDAKDDVDLYKGPFELLPFNAGMFAVFFPQELHAAGIVAANEINCASYVRRVVVKVEV